MANSFTNIFTGNPIAPTFNSYNLYTLTGNIGLNWASQFIDTPFIVYQWMDFSANAGGYIVTLPDATQASVGQFMILRNTSGAANSIIFKDNMGNTLVTLAVGTAVILALIDNTTIAGTWTTLPFAGGFSSVTSVAATSLTSGLIIGGSPITNAGTLTFSLASALSSLSTLATNGLLVQQSVGTIVAVDIVGGLNIDVDNGDGVAGNPTINLSDTLSGMSSIDVGNFNITNNVISTTSPNTNIILSPNGTGNILLGSALIPPTVTSTGNVINVNNLIATTGTIGNVVISTSNITSNAVSGNLSVGPSGTGTFSLLSSGGSNNLTMNTSGTILHPSIPKAFATFDGTGAIIFSYNIVSVTKTGTGQYTIIIPAGLIFSSSCPFGNCLSANVSTVFFTNSTLTSFTLNVKDNTNSFVDPFFTYFMVMGV
jgi:hypothetical protein